MFHAPDSTGMFLAAVGSLTTLTELDLEGEGLLMPLLASVYWLYYQRPFTMVAGRLLECGTSQHLSMPTANGKVSVPDPCTVTFDTPEPYSCMCRIGSSYFDAV